MKHGYYSGAYDRAGQVMLSEARELAVDDLTEEISVIRERLKKIILAMRDQPESIELIAIAARVLARLMATHYHIGGSATDRLVLATATVMDDIRRTLGIEGPEDDG